ncbi:MAG: hypothetical protein ACOX5C_06725 [Acutalibacteraceae bacterium]
MAESCEVEAAKTYKIRRRAAGWAAAKTKKVSRCGVVRKCIIGRRAVVWRGGSCQERA